MKDTQLEKRARILEAARKRFMHYGVAKTTMQDLAEDIQMAVGSLYLYFKNKEELVLAIAEDCRAEQALVMEGIIGDKSLTASQRLEQYFVAKYRYLTRFRTETPHGKELIEQLLKHYPYRLAEWESYFEGHIQRLLQLGIEREEFKAVDVEKTAHMLRMSLSLFFLPVHVQLPLYPEEAELVRVVRWLLDFLKEQGNA